MSEQLKLDLDPRKIIESLNDWSDATKELAKQIEDSLGKEAPKNIAKLEEAAEKGTTNVQKFFRNLGQRIREDLKTAFDATGVLAGAKFAQELGSGIKQVFDLERAFDKLNTRLQLTGKTYQDFKKNVGANVAATGQKLEDVFPGVEEAAAKGGVKEPGQLEDIAKTLAQARAATGEGTENLASTIVEILKTQGKQVTAQTFKETMDALQATRVKGAFRTAGEAGQAVESITPYAKQFGLGTREIGAMAATASRAGTAGQDILRQLFEQAAQPGRAKALNEILGQKIFNIGKGGQVTGMNAEALGKVNMNRFGSMSQQVLESATGLSGAAGGDLARFVDSFKTGMGDFNDVIKGSNETATQFEQATGNLASKVDKFRQGTMEAGREIGEGLSSAANNLLKGNIKAAGESALDAAKAVHEHKGTILAAGMLTAGVGVLAGGGIKDLLKKVGGGGGMGGLGGLAKGAAIEAATGRQVTPVYVVNAADIRTTPDAISDAIAGGADKMGKFGALAGKAGNFAKGALGVGAALEGGMAVGEAIQSIPAVEKLGDAITDYIYRALHGSTEEQLAQGEAMAKRNLTTRPNGGAVDIDHEKMANAVAKGYEMGHTKVSGKQPVQHTNPSSVAPRGGY